ncbi:histidine phosphatase family protein [bacterium]|nr:histidine phosphatase family protein [bacterium]
MPTKLYLLRHAQTADTSKFHGSESDIGLSDWGHEQARRLAKRFADTPIDAIYSSAMRRAVDTATPIASTLGLELQQVPALHERSMGELAGASRDEFRHVFTDAMIAWMAGDLNYTHPTGESYQAMRRRGVPALTDILNRNDGRTVLVVAHGMLIRVLISSLVPEWPVSKLADIRIDNCATNEFDWEGGILKPIRLFDLPEDLVNPPDDKPFW